MIGAYLPVVITIIGTGLLGLTSSVLGVFAVLRRQSLLGDAISHAALPGIVLMFLCTQVSDPLVLTLGGGIAGILGALLVRYVVQYTGISYDAVLAVVLSVFFGTGLMLLTVVQKRAYGEQAILGKFLFGNAATLLVYDLLVLAGIALCICMCLYMCWKECKLLAFDEQFAYSCGYRIQLMDALLTGLIVGAVVIGLHLVGVLLMSSLLIAPAAAARQWTSRIEYMALVAGVLGVGCCIVGSLVSNVAPQVPTGPVIVILMSICVAVSLSFGHIMRMWRRANTSLRTNRRQR